MSCCNNNTYETIINNTPVVLEEVSTGCYVSRFQSPKTKVGVRKKRLSSSCCEQIDLSKISRNFEWYDGVCSNGIITYDTIQITTRSEQIEIDVALNITPQELVNLLSDYSLTLKRAVELINTRVSTEDLNCEAEYCNEELSVPVTPICPPGTTATAGTITIPACQFTSNISIADANQQALIYIEQIKQDFISNNITCTEVDRFCNDEVSGTFLKPNCPPNTTPQLVTTTIEAGSLCGYVSQDVANIAATNSLNSQLESNAIAASQTIYCTVELPSYHVLVSTYYVRENGTVLETGTTFSFIDPFPIASTFFVGDLVTIKYNTQPSTGPGINLTKSGIVTEVLGVTFSIKDLLLDEIITGGTTIRLNLGLIKVAATNQIIDIGLQDSSILLPI